jgi:hypothetical protein
MSLRPQPWSPQESVPQHPNLSTPDAAEKGSKGKASERARKVLRAKQSFGLPVTFGEVESPATVMSCADTGSSINAISTDLAIELGLSIDLDDGDETLKIQIGSRRWISSHGKIVTACTLGSARSDSSTIGTVIHVFKRLARPGLLFGRDYIRESEMFARKLLRPISKCFAIPCVCAIGSPTRLLSYTLNQNTVTVFPDTGSEIDLISKDCRETLQIPDLA